MITDQSTVFNEGLEALLAAATVVQNRLSLLEADKKTSKLIKKQFDEISKQKDSNPAEITKLTEEKSDLIRRIGTVILKTRKLPPSNHPLYKEILTNILERLVTDYEGMQLAFEKNLEEYAAEFQTNLKNLDREVMNKNLKRLKEEQKALLNDYLEFFDNIVKELNQLVHQNEMSPESLKMVDTIQLLINQIPGFLELILQKVHVNDVEDTNRWLVKNLTKEILRDVMIILIQAEVHRAIIGYIEQPELGISLFRGNGVPDMLPGYFQKTQIKNLESTIVRIRSLCTHGSFEVDPTRLQGPLQANQSALKKAIRDALMQVKKDFIELKKLPDPLIQMYRAVYFKLKEYHLIGEEMKQITSILFLRSICPSLIDPKASPEIKRNLTLLSKSIQTIVNQHPAKEEYMQFLDDENFRRDCIAILNDIFGMMVPDVKR